MRIEQIGIRNYKSLRDVTIYSKEILSLVGRNNSGKSNVLKALQLFFEGSTRLVNNECFYCGITTDPIEITVTFDHLKPEELEEFEAYISEDSEEKIVLNRYIIYNDDKYSITNYVIIDETRKKLPNKDFNQLLPDYIYVPAVRYISEETKQFGKLITPVLKKMPEKRKAYLSEKLSKLSDGLNRSEERIDEINKIELLLNDLMCELMDCDIEIKMNIPKLDDLFVGTNIYINDGINTDIEAKGQGMQRAMIFTILRAYAKLETTILSGRVDKDKSIILGIEEPELYLHPQSQRTLMSVFRDIANKGDQVICSTQSSLFVDINYFDQICIMRRERNDSNWESYSTQLQMSAFIDDLKARKDIRVSEKGIREQYFNAFNPMVNEGFFADKVVIVEGPSEQYALPIYADVLRYNLDRNNISVVHSDGKGQMDRLFRVFNEFRIPTYLWFDGDKLTKDSENRKKTLELLKLVKDPVTDIQEVHTKITGKYAIMEYNFDKMLKQELNDLGLSCEDFLKDARMIIGPCGKPLKHRFIANELKQKISDGAAPVNVIPISIIKIVGCIKSATYNGTILQKLD